MNIQQLEQLKIYQQAETDRIRSVLLQELDVFISMLLESETSEYRDWVYELSKQVIDEENGFPIRMPLFENILFPIPHKGYKSQAPNTARWLAGFSQHIYKCKTAQKELGENYSELYFLRQAMKHEPTDNLSRRKLIRVMAWQLDYSIHEVPSGVLLGHNGASVEECDVLSGSLAEFKLLVKNTSSSEEYVQLIDDCTFHYREYKKYLVARESHDSYAAYLSSIEKGA